MKFKRYINENVTVDDSFTSLEDPRIAKEFIYTGLSLKKAPKEYAYIIKMLKKHVKPPMRSLHLKSGTKGSTHLAVFSESLDGMGINLTHVKKIKKGNFSQTSSDIDFHAKLEKAKESLVKWEAYQDKVGLRDKKTRGMVNNLKLMVRNLETKINNNEVPVPQVSTSYTKNTNDAIESVILHELGHREMNKYDVHMFQAFFGQKQFPTEYSKRNIKEYFSEIHTLTKMGLIDKTPISDEAKSYFKKVIKR